MLPVTTTVVWCIWAQTKYSCGKLTWVLFILLAPFEAGRRGVILLTQNDFVPSGTAKLMMYTSFFGYFTYAITTPYGENRDDDLNGEPHGVIGE